ncbi:MAG: DUF2798 domain-containing protein [Methanomicrobia archaeon]|nr:DUF2798 domain-containing protein [Methanomicrobia archaeon]
MKINKKYSPFLFALFMSLGMAFTMSLVMTLVNVGITEGIFLKWMRAFAIGFTVAFPTSLVIIPFVKKLVTNLTDEQ